MEHDRDGSRDSEYDEFESMLERHASAGDSEWKSSDPPTLPSAEEKSLSSAEDAEDISANDSNPNEIREQVKQAESVNAFDVVAGLSELDDVETLARESNEASAESNPELLSELLQAQMADEKVTQYSITKVEIASGPNNPGWVVTRLKEITKSAAELEAEGRPGEAYQREYYEARLLTVEQACEVMDLEELEILRRRRKIAAHKERVTEEIKASNGKVSKARIKALETDRDTRFITTPGEAAVKRARRESGYVSGEKKTKAIGPRRMEQLHELMASMGMSPDEVGQMLAKSGSLTQLDAEYLKSLQTTK